MSAENRLTAEQLAALTPGDPVTIETSGDFRRPRLTAGTVIRREARCIVVSIRSPRGLTYLLQFGRRDGVGVGGGRHAELVNADAAPTVTSKQRRRQVRVDAAYRAWARDRDDLDKLRELHAATTEALDDQHLTGSP